MKAVATFLLVLCSLALTHAWTCGEAPQLLNASQIEAGQGKVVALDGSNYPYFLIGSSWIRLGSDSTTFRYITVGRAGLWGTGTTRGTYKFVGGSFQRTSGEHMMQMDAGSDEHLLGVNTNSYAYCLNGRTAMNYSGGPLSWTFLLWRHKHISCSPHKGCWAVSNNDHVYHSRTLTPDCTNNSWKSVTQQKMKMIDVGSDGTVIALTPDGKVYERTNISETKHCGTSWESIPICMRIRSLSYDLGTLWVVTDSGIVMKCQR